MRARLFCPVRALKIDHTFESEVTVGRSPENSLVLGHEVLSGHHLRVSWNEDCGSYEIEDLGSSNGTRLDGAPVNQPQRLGHLHLITLAEQFNVVFQDLDRCAARHQQPAVTTGKETSATGPDKTMVMSLPVPIPGILQGSSSYGTADRTERTVLERLPLPVPDFLRRSELSEAGSDVRATVPPPQARSKPAPTRPIRPGEVLGPVTPAQNAGQPTLCLEVQEEAGAQHYPLREGRHILGRGRLADLQIPSPHLSRSHAILTVMGNKITLRDDGSKNSTYVDGSRILDEVAVEPGQDIAFGLLKARLVPFGRATDSQDREA